MACFQSSFGFGRYQLKLEDVTPQQVTDAWHMFEQQLGQRLSDEEEKAFAEDLKPDAESFRYSLGRDVLRAFVHLVKYTSLRDDLSVYAARRVLRGIQLPFRALLALAVAWLTGHSLLAIRGAGWVRSNNNPYARISRSIVISMTEKGRVDQETREALIDPKRRLVEASQTKERPTIINTPHVYAGSDRPFFRDFNFDLSATTDVIGEGEQLDLGGIEEEEEADDDDVVDVTDSSIKKRRTSGPSTRER